jgi:hypothetical protein
MEALWAASRGEAGKPGRVQQAGLQMDERRVVRRAARQRRLGRKAAQRFRPDEKKPRFKTGAEKALSLSSR